MSRADEIRKAAEQAVAEEIGAVAARIIALIADENRTDRVAIMRQIENAFCPGCGTAHTDDDGGYCAGCGQ